MGTHTIIEEFAGSRIFYLACTKNIVVPVKEMDTASGRNLMQRLKKHSWSYIHLLIHKHETQTYR
jgi:hypothetical protein